MSNKQEPPKPPKWTIMVYLAGDNDLTSHCVSVLQQLEAFKYPAEICVLTCFESSTPWPQGSRYLRVNCKHKDPKEKKALNWEIHNDLIVPPNGHRPVSFCDQRRRRNGSHSFPRATVAEGLRRFLDFSVDNHAESERFMLVLFGHGPIVAGQTFLVSENPGSFLRLEELQDVLSEHFGGTKRKLDILAFQNCVMNGIETAYEIRNQAKYIIGSQGLVLATGWPYEKMIGAIAERPSSKTETIARKLLKVCARSMLDFTIMDRSSEQSACNLERMRDSDNIKTALKALVAALTEAMKFEKVERNGVRRRQLTFPSICDAVRLARLEAQTYWWETFVDLYDFCERLTKRCNENIILREKTRAETRTELLAQLAVDEKSAPALGDDELLEMTRTVMNAAIEVMKEVKELVPNTHSYYIGSELQYSHGLSIYFPWTLPAGPYFAKRSRSRKEFQMETAFDTYCRYSFVKATGWANFLQAFFLATLRNIRRGNRRIGLRDEFRLDTGLTWEQHQIWQDSLSSDLTKSSPDTAKVDNLSFNIKNYPRRNYLSPLDCERKIDEAKVLKPGEPNFATRTDPPASAIGWNFSTLVAEVISKPKRSRKGRPAGGGASSNGDKPLASKALAKAVGR